MGKAEADDDQKVREELDKKLERDILDNVDINFIFNKGASLATGLIDDTRLFSVMTKLKELAYKQLESGSTQINYREIVEYVRDNEGVFASDLNLEGAEPKQQLPGVASFKDIVVRPDEVGIANQDDEKKRRWGQCVEFLRNNPKLLLQMLPDGSFEDDMEEGPGRQKDKRDQKKSRKSNHKILLEKLKNQRKNNKMSQRIEDAQAFSKQTS